jgi:hypothetical protein
MRQLFAFGKTSVLLGAAALVLSTSSGHARPCPVQNRIEAVPAAQVFAWQSAPQSIAAQLHHQPTEASVAAAEARLAAACGSRRGRASRHRG